MVTGTRPPKPGEGYVWDEESQQWVLRETISELPPVEKIKPPQPSPEHIWNEPTWSWVLPELQPYAAMYEGYDLSAAIEAGFDQSKLTKYFGEEAVAKTKKRLATPPEAMVWDYDKGEFVSTTKEGVAKREEFYTKFPEIAPTGTPGKITPAEYEEVRGKELALLEPFKSPEGGYYVGEAIKAGISKDILIKTFGQKVYDDTIRAISPQIQQLDETQRNKILFDIMKDVFPDMTVSYGYAPDEAADIAVNNLYKMMQDRTEDFVRTIQQKGRDKDSEALLMGMGFTWEQVNEFFPPIVEEDTVTKATELADVAPEKFILLMRTGYNRETKEDLLLAMGATREEIDKLLPPSEVKLPTLSWLDKFNELKDDPTQLIPYLASGKEIIDLGRLLKSAKDLEDGKEISHEEMLALKAYVEKAQQETDWTYKIADILGQLPAFAGEFILTIPFFGQGKAIATKAAVIVLKNLATKAGAKFFAGKAAQYGIKVAGVVAGGTLRTIPAGVTRIPASTIEKQLQTTLTGDEESVFTSAVKALGEQWVEIVSESTGGLFPSLSTVGKGALIKLGLMKAMQKANPEQSLSAIRKVTKAMGYNGVFQEILEERVADVGHGILEKIGLGDQKFKLPSLQQIGIELAAFSVPGVAIKAMEGISPTIAGFKAAPEAGGITPEKFMPGVPKEPVVPEKVTPGVTRAQIIEQYKKIATRHSPEVIDYVSKLSDEEVNALYRGKPAETITIADKKYYKTTLASIKGELDNYIGGVEKQQAIPKAETEKVTPEVTTLMPVSKPNLTFEQFKNWEFPVPEGGASKSPKTVLGWARDQYETLADLAKSDDTFRFNEVLGKGWEKTSGIPNSLNLSNKIKSGEKITIYRASDVGDIVPGSYVSESLKYVQEHGEIHIPGGKFQIYKLDVYPDELLTYDDPHEFIYIPRNAEAEYNRLVSKGIITKPVAIPKAEVGKVTPEVTKPKIPTDLEKRITDLVPSLKRPQQGEVWTVALRDIPQGLGEELFKLGGAKSESWLRFGVTLKDGRTYRIDIPPAGLQPQLVISEVEVAIPKAEVGKVTPEVTKERIIKPEVIIPEGVSEQQVLWHGTPSGNLVGGTSGLHIGTFEAARQALEARIGIPVEGIWDGTREYGKTLLAGKNTMKVRGDEITGYNVDAPTEDYYPTGKAVYSGRIPVELSSKPDMIPVRITGKMTNAPSTAYEDFKAGGYMSAQIKKGTAKSGYYYVNQGEDAGSISAVLPNEKHISKLERVTPAIPKAKVPTEAAKPPVAPPVKAEAIPTEKAKRLAEEAQAEGRNVPTPEQKASIPPNLPPSEQVAAHINFEPDKVSLKEKFESGKNKAIVHWIDRLYPIDKFVSEAKKTGIELSIEENPYLQARLLEGVTSKATSFIENGTFGRTFWKMERGKAVPNFKGESLSQILEPVKEPKAWKDFSTYLTSVRAQELASLGIETGIDPFIADASITELEAKYPNFSKLATKIQKYQKDLLDYVQESGLINQELRDKLDAKYYAYVPFYRVMDELASKGYMGKKMVDIASPIKRIKGSEREIINPLESILKNTYAMINAADRNQVGVAMARIAHDVPDVAPMFRHIKMPIAKVATVTAKELGIEIEGLSEVETEEVFNVFRPSLFKAENVATVMIDGKKQFFEVDPDLNKALHAVDASTMGMLWKVLSAPAKWLRAGATLSPDFMIRNPARDALSAFVFSRYGFIPGIDFVKGVASILKKDNAYKLYKMSGAEHSMLVSLDREYLQKSFKEVVEGKKFTDYVKHPLALFQIASELGEKATRLGEFKKGLSTKGVTPFEAGISSREVTLDFAKAGTQARAINQIIAFFNANIRGWERPIQAFKEAPLRTSVKIFVGITLPSIVLWFVNHDEDWWKEVPQWQKDLFWLFKVGDTIYRIPKPFELGIIFGSVPERFLDYLYEKDPKAMKDLALNLLQAGTPGWIPTGLEPIIENITNHSFFRGTPIVSEGKANLPPEFQYTQYTSEVAKGLGNLLKQSPAKIDNVIQGWTGGLGRYATLAIDKLLQGTGVVSPKIEPSPTAADIPALKAFVVRNPIGGSSESVNRFYDVLDEYTAQEQRMKMLLDDKKVAEYETEKSKHPELLLNYDDKTNTVYSATARYLRQVSGEMSDIRKLQDKIYKDSKMTPEKKRELIDGLDTIKTQLAQKALALIKNPGSEAGILEVPAKDLEDKLGTVLNPVPPISNDKPDVYGMPDLAKELGQVKGESKLKILLEKNNKILTDIVNLPDSALYKIDRTVSKAGLTKRQNELLDLYDTAENKKAFLEAHPEVKVNPKADWLKKNPESNAILALWGNAKILTQKAYDIAQDLINSNDVPDNAFPLRTMPPKEFATDYFKYNDAVDDYAANSPQARLLRTNDKFNTWLGLERIDESVKGLELKVKTYDKTKEYAALSDKESPTYIADDKVRKEAQDKFKASNSGWLEDLDRIEAHSTGTRDKPTPDNIVNKWAEHGTVSRESKGYDAEEKVFYLDNPDIHKWALENKLSTDDGKKWNEPALRIQVKPENRKIETQIADFKDKLPDISKKTDPAYKTGYQYAIEQLKATKEGIAFLDDQERIEAHQNGGAIDTSKLSDAEKRMIETYNVFTKPTVPTKENLTKAIDSIGTGIESHNDAAKLDPTYKEWHTQWRDIYSRIVADLKDARDGKPVSGERLGKDIVDLWWDIDLDAKTLDEMRKAGNTEAAAIYQEAVDKFRDTIKVLLGIEGHTEEDLRQEFLGDNPEMQRFIGMPNFVEDWVKHGQIVRDTSGNSAEVKVWLYDNKAVHDWAKKNELLKDLDPETDWNIPALRIDVKWRKQDTEYQTILDKYGGTQTKEQDAATKAFLEKNPEYKTARIERSGYQLGLKDVTKWTDYNQLPEYGYYRDRYRLTNPDFDKIVKDAQTAKGQKAWEDIDPKKIPNEQYDIITEQYKDLFKRYEDADRAGKELILKGNAEFARASMTRNAYKLLIGSEQFVPNYIEYYDKVKADVFADDYEDDWYLIEHPEFYQKMLALREWQPKDFSKVPSREVWRKYQTYRNMTNTRNKQELRAANLDLDDWLFRTGKVSELITTMKNWEEMKRLGGAGVVAAEKRRIQEESLVGAEKEFGKTSSEIDLLLAELEEKLRR